MCIESHDRVTICTPACHGLCCITRIAAYLRSHVVSYGTFAHNISYKTCDHAYLSRSIRLASKRRDSSAQMGRPAACALLTVAGNEGLTRVTPRALSCTRPCTPASLQRSVLAALEVWGGVLARWLHLLRAAADQNGQVGLRMGLHVHKGHQTNACRGRQAPAPAAPPPPR